MDDHFMANNNLGYTPPHTPKRKPLTVSPSDDISLLIETVSGNLVNPTNPDPETISLEDIAWSLSRIPRYVGHTITEIPYNVAQHSVYVTDIVGMIVEGIIVPDFHLDKDSFVFETGNEIGLHALFHDAHEAYTGDIPSPIKRIPELRETIKIVEMKLDHAIRTKFKLEEPSEDFKKVIKFADKLAQAVESYQFMPSRGLNWNLPKPTMLMLQSFSAPKSPLESYKAFIAEFNSLGG